MDSETTQADHEVLLLWQEQSRIGDALTDFMAMGYPALKEHVLDPMYLAAFKQFQRIPPDNTSAIIETQMIGKVLDMILTQINARITQGVAAKDHLIH